MENPLFENVEDKMGWHLGLLFGESISEIRHFDT